MVSSEAWITVYVKETVVDSERGPRVGCTRFLPLIEVGKKDVFVSRVRISIKG